MSTIWFIKLNGLESPVNAGKLKEYASTGRIDPKTLVKKGETGQWVPASKIKGLVFKQPSANVEMQMPSPEEIHEVSQEPSELNSNMVNQLKVDDDLHENHIRNLIDSEDDELDENLNFAAKQTFSENNFTVNLANKGDTKVTTNSVQSIEEWTIPFYLKLIVVLLSLNLIPILRNLIFDQGKPRWEYMIVSPSDNNFESEINELGVDGWELVTARRATGSNTSTVSYEMIFKRRKLIH